MKANKLIRLLTAIPLGIIAFLFLVFVSSAHVTMCMVCAIGYSVGLPIDKYENMVNKIVSFFAGGILFYTVYAGTTPLLVTWFGGYGWEIGAWGYHFIINFALLVLFLTKKDRMPYLLGGLEAFMIGSPIMFLISGFFGRGLEGKEALIPLYILIGAGIFVFHQLIARLAVNFYAKSLVIIRWLVMLSLVVFAVLELVALPIVLTSPNRDVRPGDSRPKEEYRSLP
jgi:hypothetical protein